MIDDDIPVLTQILRTGDSRAGTERDAASAGVVSASTAHADPDVAPLDPVAARDPHLIGPQPPADETTGAGAVPFDDDDDPHDPSRYAVGDDASQAGGDADSFRLPQDHDHAVAADDGRPRFDEPEIGETLDHPAMVAGPTVGMAADERRIHSFDAGEPRERRHLPFAAHEPRERRHDADNLSLQRLASITSSVRDSVLVALQTRIDTELDARIAQAMHREIETAIAQLQDKLRDGLTDALRDVVARAVDDEMTRFVAAERDDAARLDPRKPPVRPDL